MSLSIRLAPYQLQYIAWLLSYCIGADPVDLADRSLADVRAESSPHQVDAAFISRLLSDLECEECTQYVG